MRSIMPATRSFHSTQYPDWVLTGFPGFPSGLKSLDVAPAGFATQAVRSARCPVPWGQENGSHMKWLAYILPASKATF